MSLFSVMSLAAFSKIISINIKQQQNNILSVSWLNRKNYMHFITISFRNSSFNKNQYSDQNKILLATEYMYRFRKLNKVKPNLFQQLINKYWQQTVFLSESTSLSSQHIHQQGKKDSIITKSEHKKFLIDFSKALLAGRIDSQGFLSIDNTISPYIQYIWRKSFNLPLPKYWKNLWIAQRTSRFPNKYQEELINILNKNNFPLFIVINGFKQMIIAEPSEELLINRSLINMIYQWYHDHFLWKNDNNKIYEGLFFVNPEDAIEYKNYIQKQYIRSSTYHSLDILPTGLDIYYQLNRVSPPRIHFHLLPDLAEISKLLNENQQNKNFIFHPNQKYGKTFFQGQPIYFIQPLINILDKQHQTSVINYYYKIPNDPLNKKYNPIFLNKEDALFAWANFRKNTQSYKLPHKPVLLIYNLEDFLKDHENNNVTQSYIPYKDFLLIPGRNSYQEIKKSKIIIQQQSWSNIFSDYCSSYLLLGKIWTQRIIWSLSSRQPPNW
jgi:hypothetical protein